MPPYTFNPAKAQATSETFPKNDYEFQIGEPKSFIRKAGEDQHDSYGVRIPLTIKDGEFDGKKINTFSLYHQNEGAQGMAKQFIMAVMGYGKGRAEEQRFNEEQGDKDWSCDYETGGVGDAWRELTGKRVVGSLDVGKGLDGNEQQKFKSWRPVK